MDEVFSHSFVNESKTTNDQIDRLGGFQNFVENNIAYSAYDKLFLVTVKGFTTFCTGKSHRH